MSAIEKGEEAKRLLEDNIFSEAVAEVSKRLTEQWSKEEDSQHRETLWMRQKAVQDVVGYLLVAIDNGNLEKEMKKKGGFFK